jgi:hypothetical protein
MLLFYIAEIMQRHSPFVLFMLSSFTLICPAGMAIQLNDGELYYQS